MDSDRLRWLPFVLLEVAPDRGRPLPVLVEVHLPEGEPGDTNIDFEDVLKIAEWSVDAVLKNFAAHAFWWYERVLQGDDIPRRAAEADLRTWITETRALADRLPFGVPTVGRAMADAADQLEQALSWRTTMFAPSRIGLDTTADRHFRITLNLWAIDQLVRAVAALDPADILEIRLTETWRRLFGGGRPIELPFADYDLAKKRIDRLAEWIRIGRADALMVGLLREALTYGPFQADGDLRPPRLP